MNQNKFVVWHDQLGYFESIMMRKIFENFMWTPIEKP